MKRIDPLFNKPQKPVSVLAGTEQIASLHGSAPKSPIDGSLMRSSRIKTSAGIINVWVDYNNRIVYPSAG